MSATPIQSTWRSFRQVLFKLDKEKIAAGIALRNTIGILIPIVLGLTLGYPLAAAAMAAGALNVSFSDGQDPYNVRVRRMLTWSTLGGLAVFTGSVTADNPWIAIPVTAAYAFLAGMMNALGQRAGDLGMNTLVTLVVFTARPMAADDAMAAGLLAFGGGLIQTLLSSLFWPIRRFVPQRQALARLFFELADFAGSIVKHEAMQTGGARIAEARETITALAGDHSVYSDRYRILFDEAERVRLSLFMLRRHQQALELFGQQAATSLDAIASAAQRLLDFVGAYLVSSTTPQFAAELQRSIEIISQRQPKYETDVPPYLSSDTKSQVTSLAGQIRAVLEMAQTTTPAGLENLVEREQAKPWRLRTSGWLATLRANADVKLAVCRHALRLSGAIVVGDLISRSVGWQRSYWLPMTIAVVLKPEFSATFSRGVLRLGGTFTGLFLATLLFHFLPQTTFVQAVLIGLFAFALRSAGPANYGIFSAAVGALIVLLIAMTGVAPSEVIAARGINTAAGGVLALIAYSVWPTWERTQVKESVAQLLDHCREYFFAVAQIIAGSGESLSSKTALPRLGWRQARSNLENSLDRFSSEPGSKQAQLEYVRSILSSSNRLVHATMALEAGYVRAKSTLETSAFRNLADDVELTLYLLVAALRGSQSVRKWPQLRDQHNILAEDPTLKQAEKQFLVIELDRLVNSLNTMREQVDKWLATTSNGPQNELTSASADSSQQSVNR